MTPAQALWSALALQCVLIAAAWALWSRRRFDERQRTNEALQQLVGEMARAMDAPPGGDVHAAIRAAVERLAAITGAVHVSLHTGVPGGAVWVRRSYAHPATPDTESPSYYTTNMPYLYANVAAGRELLVPRFTLLPREGWADAPALLRLGVRSGFVLPLFVRGTFRGGVALGMGLDRAWRDDWIAPVRRIGELALGALVERESADATARDGARADAPPLSFEALVVTIDRARRVVFTNGHDAWPGMTVGAAYPPAGALDEHYRLVIDASVGRVLDGRAPYVGVIVRGPAERWFLVQIEPLNAPGGGAVVAHQDVSERASTHGTAARALTTLAHQQRVAALGELVSSLAHEISQPLGAIAANAKAGVLLAGSPDIPVAEVRQVFDEIGQDVARARDVVRQVRHLLRRDHAPEDVDVNRLISETIALLDTDAELRRVRITSDLAPEALVVRIDALQLQQVFMNLLTNAIDAAAASPDERRVVRTRSRSTPAGIRIDVDDTGPGIRPAQAHRVFDPFFSTKPAGLGVGLSISRSIVSVSGGRVWTEPGDLGGARFSVELPAVAPGTTSPTAAPPGVSAHAVDGGPLRT